MLKKMTCILFRPEKNKFSFCLRILHYTCKSFSIAIPIPIQYSDKKVLQYQYNTMQYQYDTITYKNGPKIYCNTITCKNGSKMYCNTFAILFYDPNSIKD